jgi:hypothetical protein
MKKTVYAAKVDEYTEISNVLNSTFYNIANGNLCEKLLLKLCLLSN